MGYMEKVLELSKRLEGSKGIQHVLVEHDRGCPALSGGGHCTCDPDVGLIEPERLNRKQRRAAAHRA